MLNRGFFLDALNKRVVFTPLSKRSMLRITEQLREFEQKYFETENIPKAAVLNFVRNNIRQQISEVLETTDTNQLTISEQNNSELYDIWHGKKLED